MLARSRSWRLWQIQCVGTWQSVVLAASIFTSLTLAVAWQITRALDERVTAALRTHPTIWFDRLGSFADLLGSMEFVAPALLAVAAVLWRRAPRQSLLLVATFALATAVELGLKQMLVHHPPSDLAPGAPLSNLTVSFPSAGFTTANAFPSGHAVRTAFLALALVTLLPYRPAYVGAAVSVVVVALTRIYTHAHWPADVVGGIVLGWAAFSLAVLLGGESPGRSAVVRAESQSGVRPGEALDATSFR